MKGEELQSQQNFKPPKQKNKTKQKEKKINEKKNKSITTHTHTKKKIRKIVTNGDIFFIINVLIPVLTLFAMTHWT